MNCRLEEDVFFAAEVIHFQRQFMPQLVRNSLMTVVLVLFVHLSRFGLEEPSECCHKCLAQEQAEEGHSHVGAQGCRGCGL